MCKDLPFGDTQSNGTFVLIVSATPTTARAREEDASRPAAETRRACELALLLVLLLLELLLLLQLLLVLSPRGEASMPECLGGGGTIGRS